MRAVTVVVHRVSVVLDEVVAVNIINITVAVVVNAVVGYLARVLPHIRL